jgi:predicted enzyme related to lactoylglutathione lyase
MKPNVIQIAIGVSDLSHAVAFYCDQVGFPLMFRSDEHNYARLDGGGVYIGLVAGGIHTRELPRSAVTIGVSDLESSYLELKTRGVEFQMPPTRQPWGETMARFADPDGNLFYLEERAGD